MVLQNNNNNNSMENPSADELMFDYSYLGVDYPVLNMPDNIQIPPTLPTNHQQFQTPTSTLPNENLQSVLEENNVLVGLESENSSFTDLQYVTNLDHQLNLWQPSLPPSNPSEPVSAPLTMSVVRQFEQDQELDSTPQAQIQSGVSLAQPNQMEVRFQNVLPGQPNIYRPTNHGMGSFNIGRNVQQVENIGIGNTQYQSLFALNTNHHLSSQFQIPSTLNTAQLVGNVNVGSSTIANQQQQESWAQQTGNTNGGSSTIVTQQQQQASWEHAVGNQQQQQQPQASWVPSNAQNMLYWPSNYQIRSSTQDMRALSQGTPSPSVVNNQHVQNLSNYYCRNNNLPTQIFHSPFPQNPTQYQVGGSSMANQQQQLTPTPPSLQYQPAVPFQYTTPNLQYQSSFTQRGGSRGNQVARPSYTQNNILQMPSSQGTQMLASPQQGHALMALPGSQNTNSMIPQARGFSRPQQLIHQVQRRPTRQPKRRTFSSGSRPQSLQRTLENRSSKLAESSVPSLIRSSFDTSEQGNRAISSWSSLILNRNRPTVTLAPDSYVLSRSPPYLLKPMRESISTRSPENNQQNPNTPILKPMRESISTRSPENNQQNPNTPIREPSRYTSLRDIGQFQGSNSPTSSASNFTLPPPQFTQQESGNHKGAIESSQQPRLGGLFLSPSNNKGKLPMFPPVSMSPGHVNNKLEAEPKKADDDATPSLRGTQKIVYDPKYESCSIPIDPHLRIFAVNDFTDEPIPTHANKRQRTNDGPSGSKDKYKRK